MEARVVLPAGGRLASGSERGREESTSGEPYEDDGGAARGAVGAGAGGGGGAGGGRGGPEHVVLEKG